MNVKYRTPLINQYLYNKADRLNIPLGGTFELTPFCNMSCKMCYVRQTSKSLQNKLLSAPEWISIGEEAKKQGMLYLLLTGGEPFSRADFKEIYQNLYKMGFVLTVNSNGTLITQKEVEWLRKYPPTRINITLYGASNETYKKLCGNEKGYDQVVHSIRLLKEAGIEVKLNYSVTPDNACDFQRIYEIAKREQLFIQTTAYMYPPLRRGNDICEGIERLSPEKAAYYTALSHYYAYGEDVFFKETEHIQLDSCVDNENDQFSGSESDRNPIRCRAGKSSFWVTWDGRISPCGMMDYPTVDLKTNSFSDAWKKLVQETQEILMPSKCTHCSLKKRCQVCAAMVVTENGNFDNIPEYRCQMVKSYPNACQKVKEFILSGKTEKDRT